MSKLRVVKPDEPGGGAMSFADACRAGLEAVLAKNAQAVVILYESSDAIGSLAVPPLETLARGMVETVRDQFLVGDGE
jgi:tryptophanase